MRKQFSLAGRGRSACSGSVWKWAVVYGDGFGREKAVTVVRNRMGGRHVSCFLFLQRTRLRMHGAGFLLGLLGTRTPSTRGQTDLKETVLCFGGGSGAEAVKLGGLMPFGAYMLPAT